MKKLIAASLVALAAMGMGSKPAEEVAPASDVEANKAIVMGLFQDLFIDHKVDEAIDKYIDPGYIQHNPAAPDGAEAIRGFFKQYYEAVPTATAVFARIICEADKCAIHYNGKQNAEDRGVAVVDIFRIANGKIVEHWDVVQPVPETSLNSNTMF